MVAVPRERRPAIAALWALAERLTKLLQDAREPLIGQIKLAWWRDMMAMLANDPAALPKGEPLLAELQATWAGQGGLEGLVDAAEAMLVAEDGSSRQAAAMAFGRALFGRSGGREYNGERWGLIWGAGLQEELLDGIDLCIEAMSRPVPSTASFDGDRALLMLDRWAGLIAERQGFRSLRREGLLLLRIGLFGR